MLSKLTLLTMLTSALVLSSSCKRGKRDITIDERDKKKAGDSVPPEGGTGQMPPDKAAEDASVQVDVEARAEPLLNKQIVQAQSLLLPLYNEVNASSEALGVELRSALEALDLLVAQKTPEKQQTFCLNLKSFEIKLKATAEPADKVAVWSKTVSSLSMKDAICE